MRTHAQAVVIGGGVIGCSILYHLAKAGWSDVVLLERSELTSGSTWHAAANIHGLHDVTNISRLQHYTMTLYKDLEAETGQSCGVFQPGSLYLAQTEAEAYGKLREICETTSRRRITDRQGWLDVAEARPPAHPADDILGIIPADDRVPFEVRQVISRLVDASEMAEFKPEWGTSIVTGFARLWGHEVGIIANDGVIFSEAALKATHFIELCEQRRIPLVFLQNTSGYMVGSESEAEGIAKHGAKMVSAVANATVPKYTVLIGGAYGAGNYGMCGRGFRPRFLFAWPNSRIATMSARTAQTVLVDIRLAGMKGEDTTEEEIEALRAEVAEQYETQSDPYYATSRIWDDGLIDPRRTRDVLGLCLALAARQDEPEPGRGLVYRM